MGRSRKYTQEEYIRMVEEINPNIEVVGVYDGIYKKILHRCKIDGNEWIDSPNEILKGRQCSVCKSIWSSKHKEYFSKYITEEQMKLYAPHSKQKINAVCPDCGNNKMISPHTLLQYGLGCKCSDGQSYPNKFMYEVLNQLGVEYIYEYQPKWSGKKRYDIYIPSISCIIENHGGQHYRKQNSTIFNLEKIEENDRLKEKTAIDNGVKHYVVLDCRKSDKNWIKNSISNSPILEILGFKLDDIDFDKCEEYALKNTVKVVADLWNNGLSVGDILNNMPIKHTTVLRYLNKAKDLGMCDYNGEEAKKRNHAIYSERARKTLGRKVYCFELDKYFDTVLDAANFLGVKCSANVSYCCNGKYNNVKGYHVCYADEIDKYVFKVAKRTKKEIYCDKTNVIYTGMKEVASIFNINVCTLQDCCQKESHYCRKTDCKFYYLHDFTKKDGTIIKGAISLGLVNG